MKTIKEKTSYRLERRRDATPAEWEQLPVRVLCSFAAVPEKEGAYGFWWRNPCNTLQNFVLYFLPGLFFLATYFFFFLILSCVYIFLYCLMLNPSLLCNEIIPTNLDDFVLALLKMWCLERCIGINLPPCNVFSILMKLDWKKRKRKKI